MHIDFGTRVKTYRYVFSRFLVYLPVIFIGFMSPSGIVYGIYNYGWVAFFWSYGVTIILVFGIPIYVTFRELKFMFHRIVIYEDGLTFRKFLRSIDMGINDIEHMIFNEAVIWVWGRGRRTAIILSIHLANGRVYKMDLRQFDSIWTRIFRQRGDDPKLPALKDFYFRWRKKMYPGINFDTVITWDWEYL